ncbi:MAG TPA: hypothetical protein VEO54_14105 [Thermoanaerobaculia bacterium]|nr:hypothetical protein [Thermoanaerobaculia bacterium]
MKTVQLSELGAVAEDVRKGETVEVRDGERVVAQVVPFPQTGIDERINELEQRGFVRPGSGEPFGDDFFTRALPKSGKSVLEQLLDDRDNGR